MFHKLLWTLRNPGTQLALSKHSPTNHNVFIENYRMKERC